MDVIDYTATATSMITALGAADGPAAQALTVGVAILGVMIGWKIFKRFVK